MGSIALPAGKQPPEDIYVHVEVPQDSNTKYEVEDGVLMVDRYVGSPMIYPMNYGYIPQTLAGDGDPLDVLVWTPEPVIPGAVIRCRPIGAMMMEDEKGPDEKIIAVPHSKVTTLYDTVQDITDLPELMRQRLQHFFEHYKDLEAGKWMKVGETVGRDQAHQLIQDAIARAQQA